MSFWQGRRVFITGHTGLRGSWLALSLQRAGAQVFGFAKPPTTSPNFFEVGGVGQNMTSTISDVCEGSSLKSALEFSEAEVVFHLAGGGGLKSSWENPTQIYETQVMGTLNLLEALRETATVRAVVVLSSDKVYRAVQEKYSFKEQDPLGGSSPIATAKACTELIVESYLQGVFSPDKYHKHKIALATARMGAVIGGGDFSSESLIFQLAQACQAGLDLPLKNPESVRPWLHVEDAVRGLLLLAEALVMHGPQAGGAWNLGAGSGNMATVDSMKRYFVESFSGKSPSGKDSPIEGRSFHSALDCNRALQDLGWKIARSPEQAIREVAQWYRDYYQ